MTLELWAQSTDRRAFYAVHREHRVRIAHRDRAELDGITVELQPVPIALGRDGERQGRRAEVGHAEIDAHGIGRLHARGDRARRAHERKLVAEARRKQGRETTNAVAALLDLAAVGVENRVARVAVARRLGGEQHELIEAHAAPAVRPSDGRGPRRAAPDAAGHSTTMTSLPRPFILVNFSFTKDPMARHRAARRSWFAAAVNASIEDFGEWTFVISLANLCGRRAPLAGNNNKQTAESPMRHILVTNAKGGCGKSTIATSLAAYFASEGYATALADYDPQASALTWLEQRPADYAPITGVAATRAA